MKPQKGTDYFDDAVIQMLPQNAWAAYASQLDPTVEWIKWSNNMELATASTTFVYSGDSSNFIDEAVGHTTIEVVNAGVQSEIAALKAEIESLRKDIKALQDMNSCNDESDVITIRDIPYQQAKDEIKAFFKGHHGESIDPTDIEERLCIDFDMAAQACEELVAEGEIIPL